MLKKVVFYHKGLDVPTGTEVPMHVRKDGTWVKVAMGTYDNKNKTIEVELDTSTEEGLLGFSAIEHNQLRGFQVTGFHEKETPNA